MALTVGDLMAVLKTCDQDVEVRLAMQPRWAFEYSIDCIAVVVEDGEDRPVVYLSEDQQIGYLPHAASIAVGYSEEEEEICCACDYLVDDCQCETEETDAFEATMRQQFPPEGM